MIAVNKLKIEWLRYKKIIIKWIKKLKMTLA
jgi:hypothetical protein